MRDGILILSVLLLVFQGDVGFARAQKAAGEKSLPSTQEGASGETIKDAQPEALSVTQHSLTVEGEVYPYTATCGRMPLEETASGKVKAHLFFTAYVVTGKEAVTKRPVTFVFNGGPGASSVWLHLGAVGPRRIPTAEEHASLSPPYNVVDNVYSWLPVTDLVFIDPVGTGYSRPTRGESGKPFFGVKEDIQSVGDFIRLYTTHFGRWLSPKFLAGESYGTYRAVGLAEHLYENFGMDFNGLILMSLALDFQSFSCSPGNDLPYMTFLPSYTAAAWHHKKLSAELQGSLPEVLRKAETWACGEYLTALARGDALQGAEREKVAEALSLYTGLTKDYVLQNNLRVGRQNFMNELIRSENLSIGIMDSRVTRRGESTDFLNDPSMVVTIGPYVAAFNDYVRQELKFETDLPYIFLSEEANAQWDWGSRIRGYVSILEPLRNVLTRSPHLKIFAASGYYDLDTPYTASTYSLSHLSLAPELQKNISTGTYEGGHMLYTNRVCLMKLSEDVCRFIKSAIAVKHD